MTGHERITAAINHKEPDKLPIDCGSMRSTGIMGLAYNTLKKYLNIQHGKTKIYDMVQQLAIPEQWYLDKFQIDSIDLARTFANDEDDWIPWNLPDGSVAYRPSWVDIRKIGEDWVCFNNDDVEIGRMSPNLVYFTQTNNPLRNKDELDLTKLPKDLNETIWNSVADPVWRWKDSDGFYNKMRSHALAVRDKGDYAQMLGVGASFFETGQFLYRTDEFLMKLVLEPKEMGYIFDALLEQYLETIDKVIDAVGDVVDVFQFGDDFGTQSSTMISHDMYKEFFYPRQKKLFQHVHDRCGAKVFLHSCGAIYNFLGDFIDAGVDIINPVQVGAAGMEPKKLKNDFGKDVVFWGGGIDTQHVLATGTPKQVREEVIRNCEIFMKDGGFIFNQVHNIVDGVPPENIIAMYEAANSINY